MTDLNDIRRHRVDSESSTNNVVKNAILRRTNEAIDDPLCLPMSGSTMSLISPPSNTNYTPHQNVTSNIQSRPHCDRSFEGVRFGSSTQLLKDTSPTKSVAR